MQSENIVETVVGDIGRALGDRFTETEHQWFTTVLARFAASVVTKVLPADEPGRTDVLNKARAAGIDIDEVLAPGP
jgi:hypothetical protein